MRPAAASARCDLPSAWLLRPRRVPDRGRRGDADARSSAARPGRLRGHRPRISRCRRQWEGDGDPGRLGIGVLAGSGVWLLLRPRTFQVIMGLSLLLRGQPLHLRDGLGCGGRPPIVEPDGGDRRLRRSAAPGAGAHRHRHRLRDDGAPPRGAAARAAWTGTDHVDGREPERTGWRTTWMIVPVVLPPGWPALMLLLDRAAARSEGGDQRTSALAAARRGAPAAMLADGRPRPPTRWATGRRRSASCWCWTGSRR